MSDERLADLHLRQLWLVLAIVVAGSFGALLYYGGEIYQEAPPIPDRIVATDGQLLFTGEQILAGQDVWRSIGGQELGSIWGHGAYTAPDWTADWLHREATWILNEWATREFDQAYEELDRERQAALRARLETEFRTNTYDPTTQTMEVSTLRAEGVAEASGRHRRRIPIPAAALGNGNRTEIQITVDRTFVPANLIVGSRDTRELGIKIYHAAVERDPVPIP